MSTKPMDWEQGPWLVRLHTVSRASYERLRLDDIVYPHWIISYVQEGDVWMESGGENERVRAGSVMLHPPELSFREFSDVPGTHLWMQASIVCSHHLDLLQLYRISPVVAIREPARFEKTFMRMLSVWTGRDQPFRDLKLTADALQLTEMILTSWEKAGSPERAEAYDSAGDRFARLIGQMSTKLADKLDRDQLAAYVRLSPNYLDRAFSREYGLTPMQMLRDMRMKRVKALLEGSEDTLEAIALQCGLNDASYLCKQFKKYCGMLPGEYREAVRNARADDLYGAGANGRASGGIARVRL